MHAVVAEPSGAAAGSIRDVVCAILGRRKSCPVEGGATAGTLSLDGIGDEHRADRAAVVLIARTGGG